MWPFKKRKPLKVPPWFEEGIVMNCGNPDCGRYGTMNTWSKKCIFCGAPMIRLEVPGAGIVEIPYKRVKE